LKWRRFTAASWWENSIHAEKTIDSSIDEADKKTEESNINIIDHGLSFLFDFTVNAVATFAAAVMSHPKVVDATANIVVAGMERKHGAA
jgi:hypothetical protein